MVVSGSIHNKFVVNNITTTTGNTSQITNTNTSSGAVTRGDSTGSTNPGITINQSQLNKLSSIEAGAQVNQNAYSYLTLGDSANNETQTAEEEMSTANFYITGTDPVSVVYDTASHTFNLSLTKVIPEYLYQLLDVSDSVSTPASGDILQYDGTQWSLSNLNSYATESWVTSQIEAAISGGGGGGGGGTIDASFVLTQVDSVTYDTTQATINFDSYAIEPDAEPVNFATLDSASSTQAGLMSAQDKIRLDNLVAQSIGLSVSTGGYDQVVSCSFPCLVIIDVGMSTHGTNSIPAFSVSCAVQSASSPVTFSFTQVGIDAFDGSMDNEVFNFNVVGSSSGIVVTHNINNAQGVTRVTTLSLG